MQMLIIPNFQSTYASFIFIYAFFFLNPILGMVLDQTRKSFKKITTKYLDKYNMYILKRKINEQVKKLKKEELLKPIRPNS